MAVNTKQVENVQVYEEPKKKHSFLKSIIIILVVIIATGGILFFLAVQDDNKGNYSAEPSVDIFSKLVVAAITTNEVNITEEEINGFLSYALSKDENNVDSSVIIEGIYTDINEDVNSAKLYIPITYKGISFGLSGNLDVHLNENSSKIDLNLSDTKTGKLPIPSKIVAKLIAGKLPEKITYSDSTISLDSNIKFYFEGENITLEIQECEIKDGNLAVKTKGAVDIISKFIKDKLDVSISDDDVINSWVDEISNLLIGQ